MTKYLDISKLPRRATKYPWAEWAKIPPGKMLEVDLHGLSCKSVGPSLYNGIQRGIAGSEGLKVRQWEGRLYITRPPEES